MIRSLVRAAAIAGFGLLQGCAGLQSSLVKPEQEVKGLAYHLPMRYFVLTVTRVGGVTTAAEWTESSIVADTRRTYALNYHPHLIGKTETTIDVNVQGLLGTANTKTLDSAAALATVAAAAARALPGKLAVDPQECGPDGSFVFLFEKATSGTRCKGEVEFSITSLPQVAAEKAATTAPTLPDADTGAGSVPGVLYRQQRPYMTQVRVVSAGVIKVDTSKILLSPNESPVMLLPYARTLFAANDGQITLDQGMPTKYVQSTDGEFVALLKVPAAVLTAYFNAVGNVFDAFSTKTAKDQELAVKQYKLALLAYKLERCKVAFEKDDKTALETLQCSELPSTVD